MFLFFQKDTLFAKQETAWETSFEHITVATWVSDEELLREKARADMIKQMETQLEKEGISVNGVNIYRLPAAVVQYNNAALNIYF